MADNEGLDPPTRHDISNVFAAIYLSSCSSSDSARYKRAWIKAKVIHSSILTAGECPDACSGVLSIALNHREIASIMAVTGAILPKNTPMQLPEMNKGKQYCPMLHKSVINKNKQKTEKILSYSIFCPLCHLHQRKQIKTKFTQLRIYFNVSDQVHIIKKHGFYKTWTFDCSSPQYSGEMVYQTMHR